ncbi:hypothetical protein LNGFDJGK_00112 [Enterobacter hormaechei]|nr:hypothetical protein LNGFDJGK_00112 [Enterobacter hormaechei]
MSCIALKGKLQYFLETLESIEDALPSLRKNLRDEYYKKMKFAIISLKRMLKILSAMKMVK